MSQSLFDGQAKSVQLKRALVRANRSESDDALFLHREIAKELADRLEVFSVKFKKIMIFRDVGFDWQSVTFLGTSDSLISVRCAPLSVESLSVDPESYDLIVAPLWLHWVDDLPRMLLALRLALKPGGVLIGAMFGGDSLIELKRCLAEAEDRIYGGVHPRTSPAVELRTLAGLMQSAGFALPVVDVDRIPLQYSSALKLMKDLSNAGESNAVSSRSRFVSGRRLIMEAARLYHNHYATGEDNLIPVTCDVLHFSGSAPLKEDQSEAE